MTRTNQGKSQFDLIAIVAVVAAFGLAWLTFDGIPRLERINQTTSEQITKNRTQTVELMRRDVEALNGTGRPWQIGERGTNPTDIISKASSNSDVAKADGGARSVTYAAADTPKGTYRIVVPTFKEVRDMKTIYYSEIRIDFHLVDAPLVAQLTCDKNEDGRHWICSIRRAEQFPSYLVIRRDGKRYCTELYHATRDGKPLYDEVKGEPNSCEHYLTNAPR